jgi:hypothetical protein
MKRDCLTTDRVAGKCRACGVYVPTGMHMPLKHIGFFCAACCPECNAKKSGEMGSPVYPVPPCCPRRS